MHFCSECGNMLYIKVSTTEEKNLIYYCRKCGNEKISINEGCSSKEVIIKKLLHHLYYFYHLHL